MKITDIVRGILAKRTGPEESCSAGEAIDRSASHSDCLVGKGSVLYDEAEIYNFLKTHPADPVERHAQFRAIVTSGHPTEIDLKEKPVVIEDDAWIAVGRSSSRG